MKRVLYCLVAFLACAGHALAAPCVGPGLDQPYPDAENVRFHHVDLPSSRFPGFWQTGVLGDAKYAIFSNGDVELRPVDTLEDWTVSVTCDARSNDCARQTKGEPPSSALAKSTALRACLAGEEVAPSEADVVVVAAVQAEPEPVVTKPEPCGLATLSVETAGEKIQSLLSLAGFDPGPVDGIIGNKTTRALLAALGDSATGLPEDTLLRQLDQLVCAKTE